MKANYGFIDPSAIMGVVISLIILAVGVFAFFITIGEIPTDTTQVELAVGNVSETGNSVFNIVGIVLIIGAIMSIVGLVYNYVR